MASWTKTSLPVSAFWSDVVHGNGKFVAIPSSDGYAAYSVDGITWNASTLPFGASRIAYGAGKFVIISKNKIAYSVDGIHWTQSTYSGALDLGAIAFGNGKFIITGGSRTYNATDGYFVKESKFLYSTDGINWTISNLPSEGSWTTLCFGGGKFVAVDYNQTAKAIYTTDGATWYPIQLPYSAQWSDIAYGNGRFVMVAKSAAASIGGTKYSLYSDDGLSWTYRNLPESAEWEEIEYGSKMFLAVAANGTTAYSLDGRTWKSGPFTKIVYISGLAFGGNKFVVVASQNHNQSSYIIEGNLIPFVVSVSVSPSNAGTVSGDGEYTSGTSVTVIATPSNGWEFLAWMEGSATVSTSASYTFTVTANRSLIAVFKQKLTACIGVNGKARKGVDMYVGVNGKARKVVAAYIGVNGKARSFL